MNHSLDHRTLAAGFADPVLDSQSVFRGILRAMSYPGQRQTLSPAVPAPPPLDRATVAVCLTLMDADTPVWLDPLADTAAVADYLKFHCGCPMVSEPGPARIAVIAAPSQMPRLAAFDAGSDQYPDRSATLLVQVPSLDDGPAVGLTGPGIKGSARLTPGGLPDWFWDDWAANGSSFPVGIDMILTCGEGLIGLPRSIRAEV